MLSWFICLFSPSLSSIRRIFLYTENISLWKWRAFSAAQAQFLHVSQAMRLVVLIFTPGHDTGSTHQDWSPGLRFCLGDSDLRVTSIKIPKKNMSQEENNASFFGNIHSLPLPINPKLLSYTVRTVLFFFLDCNYNCFTGKVITDQVDGIRRSNLRENFQATFNVKFLCEEREQLLKSYLKVSILWLIFLVWI